MKNLNFLKPLSCVDSTSVLRSKPRHNMGTQAQQEARKIWERSRDVKPIPLWLDCDTGRVFNNCPVEKSY